MISATVNMTTFADWLVPRLLLLALGTLLLFAGLVWVLVTVVGMFLA